MEPGSTLPSICYSWDLGEGLVASWRGTHTGPPGRCVTAQPCFSTDFVPIDLDEWWAQQFLARITNCS